ncbi:MAG: YceI family protein [Sphingomonas sp.]
MRAVIAIALTLATASPLPAQMQLPTMAPGKPDVRQVTPGTYKIDPAHSQLLFTVNHLGFTHYTGQFTNPSGTLVIEPAHPDAAKVNVTFPIANVQTTVPELNEHLKGSDFFDAVKYPTATFVSTKVIAKGTSATITGNLTLKGITKPIVLDAHFVGAGKAFWGEKKTNVGFTATASIKRSDFGMGIQVPLVGDRIDLVINAGFEAE